MRFIIFAVVVVLHAIGLALAQYPHMSAARAQVNFVDDNGIENARPTAGYQPQQQLASSARPARAGGNRGRRRMYAMCPPQFQRIGTECYSLLNQNSSWLEAHFFCKDKNARLAEPQKRADQKLRKFLIEHDARLGLTDPIWIGATYEWNNNYWQWRINGKNLTYNAFTELEGKQLGHHCAVYDPSVNYGWSARACPDKHRFICQHKMPKVRADNRYKVYRRWNDTYPHQLANEVLLEETNKMNRFKPEDSNEEITLRNPKHRGGPNRGRKHPIFVPTHDPATDVPNYVYNVPTTAPQPQPIYNNVEPTAGRTPRPTGLTSYDAKLRRDREKERRRQQKKIERRNRLLEKRRLREEEERKRQAEELNRAQEQQRRELEERERERDQYRQQEEQRRQHEEEQRRQQEQQDNQQQHRREQDELRVRQEHEQQQLEQQRLREQELLRQQQQQEDRRRHLQQQLQQQQQQHQPRTDSPTPYTPPTYPTYPMDDSREQRQRKIDEEWNRKMAEKLQRERDILAKRQHEREEAERLADLAKREEEARREQQRRDEEERHAKELEEQLRAEHEERTRQLKEQQERKKQQDEENRRRQQQEEEERQAAIEREQHEQEEQRKQKEREEVERLEHEERARLAEEEQKRQQRDRERQQKIDILEAEKGQIENEEEQIRKQIAEENERRQQEIEERKREDERAREAEKERVRQQEEEQKLRREKQLEELKERENERTRQEQEEKRRKYLERISRLSPEDQQRFFELRKRQKMLKEKNKNNQTVRR